MRKNRVLFVLIFLTLFSISCIVANIIGLDTAPRFDAPREPTKYIAETQEHIEVYVMLNADGRVVDFGTGAPFGGSALLRYQLEFYDVGVQGDRGIATIYRVYTPIRISNIGKPSDFSEEQIAAIYSRTEFPETYIELHTLTFSGGPAGEFAGTNSETGKSIYGTLQLDEVRKEMHVIFTEDIKQDYLILAEQVPFSNWSPAD